MKNIVESLNEIQDITPYLRKEKVDEGLKDLLGQMLNKFKQAWTYLKSVVVRVGCYFWPVDNEGNVLPAVTPLTAGKAYVDGLINKAKTFVYLDKEGARITGCNTKLESAFDVYGDEQNPWTYFRRILPNMKGKLNILEGNTDYTDIEDIISEAQIASIDPQAKHNKITTDEKLKEVVMRFIQNPGLARLMIWGAPGIGKTAILKGVVKSLKKSGRPGYKLICKTLSNETPDNFTLPAYEMGEDGKPIASVDLPKTWLPVYKPTGDDEEDQILSDKCGEGLLFIDELSRAKDDVLNILLPLINEGEFNGYKVGNKWTIMVASNRMEDDKGQNTLGTALSNRFIQYHYEPTVESWLQWAEKQNYMSPVILNWLKMGKNEQFSGQKFFYWDPNDSSPDDPTTIMCTPRSWTNALQYLSTFVKTKADYDAGVEYGDLSGYKIFDLPKDVIREALNASIPATAVDAFMAFYELIDKVGNIEMFCNDVWKNGGKKFKVSARDLNVIGLPLCQIVLNSHSDKLPTEKEMTNLCTWVVNQNSPQVASFAIDIILSIFGEGAPKSGLDKFFVMQPINASGELTDAQMKNWKKLWDPYCKKWGIKGGVAKFPDYNPGIELVIAKYGDIFSNITVDNHTSVLG